MGDAGGGGGETTKRIIVMGVAIPEKVQLHAAMLALQFGYAGFHVVSRAALNMGMSKIVFPVYRNLLALLLLLPFAYFLEKKDRPPLSWKLAAQFFLLAIVGITANQGFYLVGLDHTSPTFASAIQNSVPAITFVLATILRKGGVGKVAGTLFCVCGASVITLYKGPVIYSPAPPLRIALPAPVVGDDGDGGKSWTLGCVFLIGHCLSWASWLVLQAPVLKKYPARLTVTSYQCFFGVIQFLIVAGFCERDPQAWLVHSGAELFTVFYAGVVASGIAFAVQIWCIDRGGPVFVAVYQPVQTLVVALMASLALGEEFYLGGIIGAVLIIIGLYLVLWGKNEEAKFAHSAAAAIPSTADHNRHFNKPSLAQPLLRSPENAWPAEH